MNNSVQVYNYFLCRWRSGYGYVSDAPNRLNLIIESFLSLKSPEKSEPSYGSRYDSELKTLLASIRHATYVESTGRSLTFAHVVALEGAANHPNNIETLQQALAAIYGAAPSGFISQIINKVAFIEKEQGRSILDNLRVNHQMIESRGPLISANSDEMRLGSPSCLEDKMIADKPNTRQLKSKSEVSSKDDPSPNRPRAIVVAIIALASFALGLFIESPFFHQKIGTDLRGLLDEVREIKMRLREVAESQNELRELVKGRINPTPSGALGSSVGEFGIAKAQNYIIAKETAKVRKTQGKKGEIVAVLPKDHPLELKTKNGNWGQVSFQKDGKDLTGWIRLDLIKPAGTSP